ncbi:MAG: RraA family protein [Alphaproteobacteria bacterium]|nr:RraA family protein [Alphaproteobacteria bacterium]
MIRGSIKRPTAAIVARLKRFGTGTISNVFDKLGLAGVIRGIKAVGPGMRFCGPAFTVMEVTGEYGRYGPEELPLGELIDAAHRGDVIAVDNSGHPVSTWGGVASYAAARKRIGGLLVDGGVRDIDQVSKLRFPIFARHVVPVTGKGRIKVLSINQPVRIDGTLVRPGDILVGDASGAVVVPAERAAEIAALAAAQDAADRRIMRNVRRGFSFAEASRRAGVR